MLALASDTHTHTHTHIYIYMCVCVCFITAEKSILSMTALPANPIAPVHVATPGKYCTVAEREG
jgi:hypothetical protein